MATFIALLRGINIGGNHPLPMKELSALLTEMGLRDVQTYIQSGNVVFRCDEKNKAALAAKISSAIKAQHGFAPQVLCSMRRSCARRWRTILIRKQRLIPNP
jgi:uncharacterized protein (DUF1697 family)